MAPDTTPRVFDARPYQYQGREPCADIKKALEKLQPDRAFGRVNPFDRRPLKALMEVLGCSSSAEGKGPDPTVATWARATTAYRVQSPQIRPPSPRSHP